ncbi:MAG: hypothetical protein HUU38_32205, partial [Anaerolineales bacterium]|nr:hypothetical protein [Anaerolineales bacterium]
MKKLLTILSLLVIASFVLGACTPAATPTEAPTEVATEEMAEPTEEPTEVPAPTEVPTEVPTNTPEPTPEPTEPPIGSAEHPIKVLFVPSVDANVIVTGGEVMAQALNEATGL